MIMIVIVIMVRWRDGNWVTWEFGGCNFFFFFVSLFLFSLPFMLDCHHDCDHECNQEMRQDDPCDFRQNKTGLSTRSERRKRKEPLK